MATNDRDLTWPALLAHWTAFAQGSLALPKNAEGKRWRDAVPAIIGLQAVTHALGELDKLASDDHRAAAGNLAAVGISSHTATLEQLWQGEALHPELAALITDAHAALTSARSAGMPAPRPMPTAVDANAGVEWLVSGDRLVTDHPGDLIEALLRAGFDGDLYLPVPGTVLFKHAPAAFARARSGQAPPPEFTGVIREFLNGFGGVAKHTATPRPRQVYRQFDFSQKRNGGVVRDVVCPMDGPPPGGQPQLVPAIIRGGAVPVTLPIPGMASVDPVPVVVMNAPE